VNITVKKQTASTAQNPDRLTMLMSPNASVRGKVILINSWLHKGTLSGATRKVTGVIIADLKRRAAMPADKRFGNLP
jgi:hypothetical protein